MAERVTLCRRDNLTSGEAQRFDVGGHRIALVRVGDDFYAIGDTCTHKNYSLAEGDVYPEDLEIECWKHGSTFSLKTGEPSALPATEPEPVYEVVLDGDDVQVNLP
ncbi:MAG TPA: non-heme iron oxygenase ferredoxin subunit [Acidimicrobiales bacterium]|jgi:3-phenylpropionate/trans-cinnamate dioxygenase ferredoxin subunit|nr:non-heme iron oxygenase ferredoxin subunit [Acidimicrobiales bacterium]